MGGRRPTDWEPTYPPARAPWQRELRRTRQEERRQRRLAGARPGARPPKARAPGPEREQRRDRRTLPARVTFTVAPPPGYEHMSIEEVRAHFRRLLDARVALIHEQRRAAGLERSLGVAAELAQDPREAGDTFPTFARNPRIACLSREARIGLLAGLREWRGRYRSALEGWRKGDGRTGHRYEEAGIAERLGAIDVETLIETGTAAGEHATLLGKLFRFGGKWLVLLAALLMAAGWRLVTRRRASR